MRPAFQDASMEGPYQREGYVVVPFLDREELDALSALHAEAMSGVAAGFYSSLWSNDVAYREHVHREIGRILDQPARRLLRDYRLVLGNLVVKHPQKEDSKVPVHQDWSVIDEEQHLPVSVWCPLIDVNTVNGCLAVVPGSHRLVGGHRPNQPHGLGFSPYRDLHEKIESAHLVEIPLRAGYAIVYSPALLHGSRVNRSDSTRVAVAAMFIPDEARLQHYFQSEVDHIDVYDVPEDFYWRDVVLASPPDSEGRVDTVRARNQPLSQEEFDALIAKLRDD